MLSEGAFGVCAELGQMESAPWLVHVLSPEHQGKKKTLPA